MDKLLTEKQVTEIIGFKRTKLYQMIKKGDFPTPKKYGRTNRWFQSDIEDWLKKEKEGLETLLKGNNKIIKGAFNCPFFLYERFRT